MAVANYDCDLKFNPVERVLTGVFGGGLLGRLLSSPRGNARAYRAGAPQSSGALCVLPVFGPDHGERFAPPLSGLKLGGVKLGYGNVELHAPAAAPGRKDTVAIVPLHMGYVQDGAQNHALCRSALLASGQRRLFDDACCVQQAQGGYLEGREQWFFVLPLQLRQAALEARGRRHYGKLWHAIAVMNRILDLPPIGHLEHLLCRRRSYLTQYRSRFELLPEQVGAMFFLRDGAGGYRLVGVEIAPSPACFAELWMPLVCFCYGPAAMAYEMKIAAAGERPTETDGVRVGKVDDAGLDAAADSAVWDVESLDDLRNRLLDARLERQRQLREPLLAEYPQPMSKRLEERLDSLKLFTVTGRSLVGQIVEDEGVLVYASLFAATSAAPNPKGE
jgi:hypothetical protein